jgi:hypothetical protein
MQDPDKPSLAIFLVVTFVCKSWGLVYARLRRLDGYNTHYYRKNALSLTILHTELVKTGFSP